MEHKLSEYFNLLLNLNEHWQVVNITTDFDLKEINIEIKYVGKEVTYGDDNKRYKIYDHAKQRKWRHLDTMEYKTYILCRLPRIIDGQNKVKTISPPWASKHDRYTFLFEAQVITLLQITKNQTKTAEFMRCGFRVINSIIHKSCERGLKRRNLQNMSLKHLSIDEKSFKRGHHYVSVLSSPAGGYVIDIEEGRTKDSAKKLLDKSLTPQQQSDVETISMDMWDAYMSASKEKLPNAEIVHDKFHLIKYLNDAIDKVRRREVKSNQELRNSRWALLKNQCNLTEKQRIKFEAIRNANYNVSKAWEVRENFKDLFGIEKETRHAFYLFYKWAANSKNKQIKEINKVVETFLKHVVGVTNALVSSFNNAMAERLNGKIQEIKTIGRGYRTFNNFRSAILFFHGGLDLYPQ